jgi:hypothetical protein
LVVRYDFYGADIDANGNTVISHITGNDVVTTNTVSVSGDWQPIDQRDFPSSTLNLRPTTADITLKSIATQKRVNLVNDTGSVGSTPEDTIEYNLDIQISDYFGFGNLVLNDIMSDGQRYGSSFTPTKLALIKMVVLILELWIWQI